jgi:hypothetical protein
MCEPEGVGPTTRALRNVTDVQRPRLLHENLKEQPGKEGNEEMTCVGVMGVQQQQRQRRRRRHVHAQCMHI